MTSTVVEPGRRERKKQAQRDAIRQEALALIAVQGIEGTTIDAICDGADIARKTFYNYYNSKHELLVDVCESVLMARLEGTIDEALALPRSLAEQWDGIFGAIAERNRAAGELEKDLIEFMVSNLAVNPAEGAGQLTTMNRAFQRLYEHHRSELRPGLTPEFCAEMTVGMSNAVTLNWLHSEHYDAERRYRQLSDYLKASMLAVGELEENTT